MRSYECPVEATLDVIGGKWKPLILFYLLQETRRFGELRRLMPDVTQRMLTKHLRELEAAGVVHREVYREVPPKVEYSLTALGHTLEPVLTMMLKWGQNYIGNLEKAGVEDEPSVKASKPRVQVSLKT